MSLVKVKGVYEEVLCGLIKANKLKVLWKLSLWLSIKSRQEMKLPKGLKHEVSIS
ncbi:MAG: hypothetical protein QW733_06795 [Desulfurococcaceae archaeon]